MSLHDRSGEMSREVCALCGTALIECTHCGLWMCECAANDEAGGHPMTDDVTARARAEAERRWSEPGNVNGLTYPSGAVRTYQRGAFVAGAEWQRAQDAETIAALRAEVERLRGRAAAAEAERDALRAKVAAVEALAGEHWDWKAGQVLANHLRAALADPKEGE